jgi:pimeloyl-ACP methyl ester carboxylesterase
MAEQIGEWGSARVAEMMGPRLLAPRSFQARPEVVAEVRRVVENTSSAAIACAQRGMSVRPDVTELLSSIRVPTLVLVGQEDVISPPAEMRSIAAAIPDSQFVEIPGAGHMTTMENPAAVNAALRSFLDEIVDSG